MTKQAVYKKCERFPHLIQQPKTHRLAPLTSFNELRTERAETGETKEKGKVHYDFFFFVFNNVITPLALFRRDS